ncbi:hypothetical protein M5689_015473 [Euphorbia peplus]|nr:hypothetical protein M5689_015473 [Euphorbia peplus]
MTEYRISSFHFVTETNSEVHSLPQRKGPQSRAVFSLLKSPVHVLWFAHYGAKLAVGFGVSDPDETEKVKKDVGRNDVL